MKELSAEKAKAIRLWFARFTKPYDKYDSGASFEPAALEAVGALLGHIEALESSLAAERKRADDAVSYLKEVMGESELEGGWQSGFWNEMQSKMADLERRKT